MTVREREREREREMLFDERDDDYRREERECVVID